MDDRSDDLANRLRAEGEAALAYFRGLPVEAWNQEVYSEGQSWCIRDLLAHFIAAEQGFHLLIQDVADGGGGAGVDFVVDEYNQRTVAELGRLEADVLIEQYAGVRERTAALVAGLTPEQLARSGRHPAAGVATVGEMVRIIYHHNKYHLRDARQVLKGAPTGGAV